MTDFVFKPRAPALAILACTGLLASPLAQAQSCSAEDGKPFAVAFTFQEQMDPTVQCPVPLLAAAPVFRLQGAGSGNAPIGAVSAVSQNCVISPSRIVANGLDFIGPRFVLSTASGEQIYAAYSGIASPSVSTPGAGMYELNGVYTIIGGTGRYARARGCGRLWGQQQVSFAFPPSGTGTIVLQGTIVQDSDDD